MNLGNKIICNYGLGDYQKAKLNEINSKYKELLNVIDENLQDGREKSLVITKIQEASMWTTRSLAIEPTSPFNDN